MALNNLGLGFVFTAKDLASGTMKKLQHRVRGLRGESEAAGAAMKRGFTVAVAGLVPLVAGISGFAASGALANAAGEFEQGMAGVRAITRATNEEFELLRASAKRAGIETQFDPTEAVEGLNSLAAAGQTAEAATRSLVPVLDLAAGSGGQLGVAQSAEAVVGTLNAYSMSADRATEVTDKLLRTTQLSNFQARDFEAGLSKAAAAGSQFEQSLDDVLITMGLLRNANIDASSSSTAFREATRRLGSDQRVQKQLHKAGVKVFDEHTGKMRSVIDIMRDMSTATADMTDKQRNNLVANTLGARGLLAFNAVNKAQVETMRDGQKVTLQGAEAIEFLRTQMEQTEGTAAKFREALADTFEGQKTLLSGTLATFAISLGEPFARIFKPVVMAVVNSLNFLLETFESMPSGLKDALAIVTLFASTIFTLGGAFLIFKGIAIALAPVLVVIKAQFLAMAAAALPVIGIIAAVGAAVFGFVMLVKNNFLGMGDFFDSVFGKVGLALGALKQLFLKGEISGPIVGDLTKAGNEGVLSFVESVGVWIHRAKKFFDGFSTGVSEGLVGLRPFFMSLKAALIELGGALGFIGDTADDTGDRIPVQGFKEFGRILGNVMTFGIGIVSVWAARVIKNVTMVVNFFRFLGSAVSFVFDGIQIAAVRVSNFVVNSFDKLLNMVDGVIASVGGLAAEVPVEMRPSGLDALAKAGEQAQARVATRTTDIANRNAAADTTVAQIEREQIIAGVQDRERERQTEALVAALERVGERQGREQRIVLEVDGERLAETSSKAARRERARGHVPVESPA